VVARCLVSILLGAATFLAASAATAKEFDPGDLCICNSTHCHAISNRPALDALSVFYYTGGKPPPIASSVRVGAPAFELRFTNGYVTGIVATAKLDRFLSYGVNLGGFKRAHWYRVPERAASELRRLTRHLKPLRVTRDSLSRSR
jgi:hypothetical protein